jgi:hypothetical protein
MENDNNIDRRKNARREEDGSLLQRLKLQQGTAQEISRLKDKLEDANKEISQLKDKLEDANKEISQLRHLV